jgi:hypothetical protein
MAWLLLFHDGVDFHGGYLVWLGNYPNGVQENITGI